MSSQYQVLTILQAGGNGQPAQIEFNGQTWSTVSTTSGMSGTSPLMLGIPTAAGPFPFGLADNSMFTTSGSSAQLAAVSGTAYCINNATPGPILFSILTEVGPSGTAIVSAPSTVLIPSGGSINFQFVSDATPTSPILVTLLPFGCSGTPAPPAPLQPGNWWTRFVAWAKAHKVEAIIILIIAVILVLALIAGIGKLVSKN